MSCKNCQGEGYYYEGGYSFAWSEEQAEEFKHTCNECKGTGMEFKKYSSLSNSNNNKTIPFAIEATGNAICEATEKLHGSNMSIHMSSESDLPVFGRRKDFLAEDESFNGSIQFRSLLTLWMLNLWGDAPPVIKSISVYGELYGGNGKGRKAVQSEIKYCEELRFRVFDMFIGYIEDGELKYAWADTDSMRQLCGEAGFEVAEPVHTGTLTELLTLDPEFKSLASEYDEPAEGWVIRPVDNIRMYSGDRVIIKHKSKAFNDKSFRTPKVPKELSAELIKALEEALCYVTAHRTASNMSRDGLVEMSQIGAGIKAVREDIAQDMLKDEFTLVTALEKPDLKIYNKHLNQAVAKSVKEYFLNS